MNDNCHWILRPDIVSTVLNDGAVLLDLRSKFFFSANASAWAVALMFENGTTFAEVYQACERWGASPRDPAIQALLDQIMAEDLIEPSTNGILPTEPISLIPWVAPTLTKHRDPLQRIMVSAFDPGLPIAE
ncbi:MAG: hypothetical protein KKF30_01680 [Proteobacteria bacterium]|nr:hypothetical protein [Pseudomonadota bacterium]MBU4471454.1 hypothetical protein [Pseudomonadota bacterium]MCG2752461.1 hypothetical protein [Desulfobacteraceae bacterium]